MSSHRATASAPESAAYDLATTASRPGVARVSADPLADAVRLAIASLLPGGEALRSLESASIVPSAGLNVPDSVQ
jgi:hypothetical protein